MKTELTAWELTDEHAGMILNWRKKARLRTGTIGRVTHHGSHDNCYVQVELRTPADMAVLAGGDVVHVHP
ncbi:hypothetical protein ACQPW1_10400 [Nocardia sp. CA-128927]|uniref:hypothetical protein n=1 Tax=Nocardia sp. CA-128927 TaxID=3239975 RepID=UPI003D96FE14